MFVKPVDPFRLNLGSQISMRNWRLEVEQLIEGGQLSFIFKSNGFEIRDDGCWPSIFLTSSRLKVFELHRTISSGASGQKSKRLKCLLGVYWVRIDVASSHRIDTVFLNGGSKRGDVLFLVEKQFTQS